MINNISLHDLASYITFLNIMLPNLCCQTIDIACLIFYDYYDDLLLDVYISSFMARSFLLTTWRAFLKTFLSRFLRKTFSFSKIIATSFPLRNSVTVFSKRNSRSVRLSQRSVSCLPEAVQLIGHKASQVPVFTLSYSILSIQPKQVCQLIYIKKPCVAKINLRNSYPQVYNFLN